LESRGFLAELYNYNDMEVLRLAGVGNIGGLQRCVLINHTDVIEMYEPHRYATGEDTNGLELPVSALRLKPNAELLQIWFVPGEGSFESTGFGSEQPTGGGAFVHKVMFEPPGDWPAVGSKLHTMKRKKWLVVMEDTNGLVRLAGGRKQGLKLDYGYKGANRRYNITLEAVVAHDAYYLKGFDLVDFTGSTSGFSEGFSFGFES
jgi:hypothetical protein